MCVDLCPINYDRFFEDIRIYDSIHSSMKLFARNFGNHKLDMGVYLKEFHHQVVYFDAIRMVVDEFTKCMLFLLDRESSSLVVFV